MPKTSERISWHEPTDMPISSATSLMVIRRFFNTISFTASTFSSVVDVLGRPGRGSSSTFSRPSWNSFYHLCTFFLLRVDSLYAIVNISRALEHWIPFFTQNLMPTLCSILFDRRKSPSTPNTSNLLRLCQKNNTCYIVKTVNI